MKLIPFSATMLPHPMKTIRIRLAGLALLFSTVPVVAGEFFLRDGDRVVFLGDSITEQRLYTNYIEAYALSRHSAWKLSFRNAGWGGDTSWLRMRFRTDETQLFASDEARQAEIVGRAVAFGLQRDVLPLRPTAVLVNFGMNDHSYQAFRPDILRTYVRSQSEIAKGLIAGGARVAFLTPQPLEEKRADPDQDVRNQSLRRFCDALRDVADRSGATFVDEFTPYLAVMMSSPGTIGRGDAIHPGPTGQLIMAWAILKGLGATPFVAAATIDARIGRVESAQACKVDGLKIEDGVITFDRLDDALPMPVDSRADFAVGLVPFYADLNLLELKVTGLTTGVAYTIQIDGKTAATVGATELGTGWRFARSGGPITDQAQDLLALIVKKNDRYFQRWRNVQLFSVPEWAVAPADLEKKRQAELERLDREIAELEAAIDATRLPKTHRFRIAPVPKTP